MVFLVLSVSDGPLMFIPAVFKTQMIFVLLLLYLLFSLCRLVCANTFLPHSTILNTSALFWWESGVWRGFLGQCFRLRNLAESIKLASTLIGFKQSFLRFFFLFFLVLFFCRISLVNSAVVAYFMDDLQINKHFILFKKLLFMEDGEFSLSLSNQLFEKVWWLLQFSSPSDVSRRGVHV